MIEQATNIVKACILPSLTVKLGEHHIDEKNFTEFLPILRNNLQTLLDIFHANQHDLLTVDLDTLEFRTHFILLLCEQSTEHDTVFQTSDIHIKATLKNLCHKHVQKLCRDDATLVHHLFECYHKSLSKDNWKHNLGAMNGFLTFVQCLYGNVTSETNLSLDYDKSQFLLATGLNFLDHFEPHIQIIGIRVFNILLNPWNSRHVSEYNMDLVILEDVEKLTNKSKEVDFESALWQCLLSCCSLKIDAYVPERWSKFDDIFEKLLEKLAVVADKALSMLYLNYVIKFSILGESRFNDFHDFLEINSFKEQISATTDQGEVQTRKLSEVIKTFREACPFANLRIFRWVKKLLIVFQNEAFKLGGSELMVATHLNELHIFYCVTIFTVPPQVLRRDFVNFCTKFIATLLETYQIFKADPFICQCIMEFLITIQVHLSRVNDTESLDPKIAPIVQKLCLECDESKTQEEESILEDMKECEKALTMLLEKLKP